VKSALLSEATRTVAASRMVRREPCVIFMSNVTSDWAHRMPWGAIDTIRVILKGTLGFH
jgi:hypothetical protein